MDLLEFELIQSEDIGYLRQVVCRFGHKPPLTLLTPQPDERNNPKAEHITFRMGIEWENAPRVNDCLLAALKQVRDVIVQEIKRRSPPGSP